MCLLNWWQVRWVTAVHFADGIFSKSRFAATYSGECDANWLGSFLQDGGKRWILHSSTTFILWASGIECRTISIIGCTIPISYFVVEERSLKNHWWLFQDTNPEKLLQWCQGGEITTITFLCLGYNTMVVHWAQYSLGFLTPSHQQCCLILGQELVFGTLVQTWT